MRLIQNMCTISEYPAPGSAAAADCCLGAAGRRLVKIAVVGASGVGKTGESSRSGENPFNSPAGGGRPRWESRLIEAWWREGSCHRTARSLLLTRCPSGGTLAIVLSNPFLNHMRETN